MNIQIVFLLTFLAGVLTAWLVMRAVSQTEKFRIDTIKQQIALMDGNIISIDLIDRKDCPFSNEYKNPNLLYRFYKITYNNAKHEMKEGWAILNMEQNWFGPYGDTQKNWTWRF